jgi:hypothetical protein
MAEERFDDSLTDAAVDRELSSLLNEMPAPEFIARLRLQAAVNPMTPAQWLPRLVMALTATALVAIAVGSYVGAGFSRPELPLPVSTATTDIGLTAVNVTDVPTPPLVRPVPVTRRPSRVVVSPTEAEGIRALQRAFADGLMPADVFQEQSAVELMALEAIAIEPLQALTPLEQE